MLPYSLARASRHASALALALLVGCTFDPAPLDPVRGVDAGPDLPQCGRPSDLCEHGLRRALELDRSGVTETLLEVPVLVRLDPERIDYAKLREDGRDLRFRWGEEQRDLAYDIERWSPGGSSLIWVRVPEVAAAEAEATPLWMYYGSPEAEAADAHPSAVWKPQYRSVHHLGADLKDASLSGHNGHSPSPPLEVEGQLGGARAFDGESTVIVLPNETGYDFATTMSLSLWMRSAAAAHPFETIIAKGDSAWHLRRDASQQHIEFRTTSLGRDSTKVGTVTVNDGAWHHVFLVLDGERKLLYIDGELDTAGDYSGRLDNTADLVRVGENSTVPGQSYRGELDELRLSEAPRSASWVRFQYRAGSGAGVVAFGPEESL
ncbi:DUF2341 domain-containing protein [Haliangium ochraceum]|uniref:DUF2341 domain-containing protein n=1 Tax=Haliangium ochraceum (strain DSM 14365 / JCM 11303 / SMP-2) TaxID=502025 RepID=D0LWF0_HALO1|nr:DUF2341 domain-containing protein [Haliangium ochraceum]ACY17600.1 hypothetical protein Hoch_5112 [Haliangium ochraceum DSM 14365]